MAAKKSTKKSKKLDALTEALLQVELCGAKGIAVCAPNKLKGQVQAIKYTASGKISPSDRLIKAEIFDHVKEMGQREFEILVSKKTKVLSVAYYHLSLRGEAHLSEYRLRLKKQKKDQMATLDGLEEVIEENRKQGKEIAGKLSAIMDIPQSFCGQFQTEVEKVQEDATGKIEETSNQFSDIVSDLQKNIQEVLEKVSIKIGDIEKNLHAKVQKLDDSLRNSVNLQLQNNLELHWNTHLQEVGILQQQLTEYTQEERFLGDALNSKLRQERQKILVEMENSLQSFEELVMSNILEVLSPEHLDGIPEIYGKITSEGVAISPGHFNDLLWKLAQQDKIMLGAWDRTLSSLPAPHHAIVRQEIFFYAKKLTEK